MSDTADSLFQTPEATAWQGWTPSVAVAIVTLAVFAPAVRYDFVNWDDGLYVYDNPVVSGGLTVANVWNAVTGVFGGNWAPVTMLSYQCDALMFGTAPWGFHLTNVVVHAATAGLLARLWGRVTNRPGYGAIAALLFAVHPLRVESVAWISERKDVLSGLGLTLALFAYERYCRRPGRGRLGLVLAAMLGGLLCKATLVTLPVLLLMLDVWPFERLTLGSAAPARAGEGESRYPPSSLAACVSEKLPLFGLSLLFAAITFATQAGSGAVAGERDHPLVASRIPTAVYAVGWYAWKTFVPTGLGGFHAHPGPHWPPFEVVAASAAVTLAMVVAAYVSLRRTPVLSMGIGWYLVALAPVAGVIQIGSHSVAERYTYIPHVGLLAAVAWGGAAAARALGGSRRAVFAGACVVAGLLAWSTQRLLPVWRDSDSLWTHGLALDERNYMAHTKRGTSYVEAGDLVSAKRHYLAALESSGGAVNVCARLAGVHFDLGEYASARDLRDRAIAGNPDDPYTRWIVKKMRRGPSSAVPAAVSKQVRAGIEAARAGHGDAAITCFEQSIATDPDCGDAWNNLGLALGDAGRGLEAVTALARAVAINPLHADYQFNLGRALERSGDLPAARDAFEAARALDPLDKAIALEHDRLLSRLGEAADRRQSPHRPRP